jgi:ubiquinone/menaquinone biosynthesis C-methylase UbiE
MFKDNLYDDIDPKEYEERWKSTPRERYLYEHWVPIISSLIKKYSKDSIVLDMGCGSGNYSFEMKKYAKKVFGIDSSERMISYAQKRYLGIDFVLGDATCTTLEKESVDVVFSFGLFEYVKRDIILGEIYRLLKNNGIIVFSVPNRHSFSRLVDRFIHKITGKEHIPVEPTFKEMINALARYRFEIIEYKMDDGLVWLPGFLDRLIGIKIYKFVEGFFRIFKRNPFGMNMLFVIKKI